MVYKQPDASQYFRLSRGCLTLAKSVDFQNLVATGRLKTSSSNASSGIMAFDLLVEVEFVHIIYSFIGVKVNFF